MILENDTDIQVKIEEQDDSYMIKIEESEHDYCNEDILMQTNEIEEDNPFKMRNDTQNIIIPILKKFYGKTYFVGLRNLKRGKFQESLWKEEKRKKPIHFYPPKLLVVNFARPKWYDMKLQTLLIENEEILRQSSCKSEQNTILLERQIIGSQLLESKKVEIRRYWFTLFFKFMQRYPPCCQRVKNFWKWVFMLNPDSNFQWRFMYFSIEWLEVMTAYVEFREFFENWLDCFDLDILKELTTAQNTFQHQLYLRFLRELLVMRSQESHHIEELEMRNDIQLQIMNQGVLIRPEGYMKQCICPFSLKDYRICLNPKINKVLLNTKMKIFKKHSTIDSLFTLSLESSNISLQQPSLNPIPDFENINHQLPSDLIDNTNLPITSEKQIIYNPPCNIDL